MNSINKKGWSKIWLIRLIIFTLSSVAIFGFAALYAYKYWDKSYTFIIWGIWLITTIIVNKYITKKNKEFIEAQNSK